MSEYIVKLPTYGAADEFFKTHEMPDMTLYGYPLTGEIVRCRDCANPSFDEFGGGWCNENCREVKPWDYCAWAKRKEGK